jgi:predicted dithiol-disulfide oxidoreductase (DUF899 family)
MTDVHTKAQWLDARMELLKQEKAHARAGDELAALRRALPRLKVTENYVFSDSDGDVTLADLFEQRSQLIVQHFMFGADWDEGCPSCSFWADGYNPMIVHLNQRDVSFAIVSSAPAAKLAAYQKRMGWSITWVSSAGNSFNVDFEVSPSDKQVAAGQMRYNYQQSPIRGSEMHGVSVFERDADDSIYHTYSTYARGLDRMNAAYGYLDICPKGRHEEDLPFGMAWVKRHDEY